MWFYSFSLTLRSLIIIPTFYAFKGKYREGLLITLMLSELAENKFYVSSFTWNERSRCLSRWIMINILHFLLESMQSYDTSCLVLVFSWWIMLSLSGRFWSAPWLVWWMSSAFNQIASKYSLKPVTWYSLFVMVQKTHTLLFKALLENHLDSSVSSHQLNITFVRL